MPRKKPPVSIDEQIGQRIAMLRGNRRQQDVAAAVGVSKEIMVHWEAGTRKIKADHLVKLAKFFGVTSDYLLGLPTALVPSDEEKKQVVASYLGISTEAAEAAHTFFIDRCGETFEKGEYSPKDLLSDLMADDADQNTFFMSLVNFCKAVRSIGTSDDVLVLDGDTEACVSELRLALSVQQMSTTLYGIAAERLEEA